MNLLEELEKKFNTISQQSEKYLSDFLNEALPLALDRVISKGALYNIRPYEIERAGFKKGKKLNKLPANINNTHVYHLNGNGVLVFFEIYGQSANIVSKEFCFYGDDRLERLHFTSIGDLRNISVSLFEGEMMVKDYNWGEYGCSISDYIYSDARLEKIMVQQREWADESFSEFEVIFTYAGEDLKRILNVFPNGYQEQRYP